MSYILKVPKGTGNIYGNLIRQIAICGIYTWRPIAYYIGSKDNSIGLKGNIHFDTLSFFRSKLEIIQLPNTLENCILENFIFNGQKYISKNFSLEFDKPLNCTNLSAYFLYSSGVRSVEKNAAYLSFLENIEDYICISSRHSESKSIAYKIEDLDEQSENILFDTTEDINVYISIIKNTIESF